MNSEEREDSRQAAGAEPAAANEVDPDADHPDVAALGYEQARDELAEVVRRLEAGGLSLEDSLALWERGEALANVCERHLTGARERVDRALASVREQDDSSAE